MAYDPLSQYRQTPSAPKGGTLPPTMPEEYAAFGTKDRVKRLRIRSTGFPVNALNYNILLNVVYDPDVGTNFILIYTVVEVRVLGRNLQKMIYAIENEMADFIQEYDPERWERPKDANAPMIDFIEVTLVKSAGSNKDTQH